MTAENKPKDANVREFWIFDDGGPEFDRRVLDRPISANDVHVVDFASYTAAIAELATSENKRHNLDLMVGGLQAEVERLKGTREFYRNSVAEHGPHTTLQEENKSLTDKIASLEKMIEVSEKALEFYGNTLIYDDNGVKARSALEQIKQMKAGLW